MHPTSRAARMSRWHMGGEASKRQSLHHVFVPAVKHLGRLRGCSTHPKSRGIPTREPWGSRAVGSSSCRVSEAHPPGPLGSESLGRPGPQRHIQPQQELSQQLFLGLPLPPLSGDTSSIPQPLATRAFTHGLLSPEAGHTTRSYSSFW